MSIIRVVKDKGYFAVSNVPFNDINLSWEARGIMGYLLSKPDGWQVNVSDLIKSGGAKLHKIRRILKELETHGYLKRKQTQDGQGKIIWISTVYETPNKTIGRLPVDGSPVDGKPMDIVSTEVTSNKEQVTESANYGDKDPEIEAFLQRVPESARGLAEAFCYMHGRSPTQNEERYWRKCWNEQLQIGLTGDLIIHAYRYMDKNSLTVKSPQSLNAVAERIKREDHGFTRITHIDDGMETIELGDVKYLAPKSKTVNQ